MAKFFNVLLRIEHWVWLFNLEFLARNYCSYSVHFNASLPLVRPILRAGRESRTNFGYSKRKNKKQFPFLFTCRHSVDWLLSRSDGMQIDKFSCLWLWSISLSFRHLWHNVMKLANLSHQTCENWNIFFSRSTFWSEKKTKIFLSHFKCHSVDSKSNTFLHRIAGD